MRSNSRKKLWFFRKNVFLFFSRRFSRCYGAQAVHVVRRKPWLPRFGTGVRPPAGTAFSVSLFLLLCSCGPAASFVVRAACFNMRPLLFSVGHSSCFISFLLLFQASRHAAVANGFRHSWGCACICSRGAFCHNSPYCTVMGLELGFFIHFLGSASLSQFARFHSK